MIRLIEKTYEIAPWYIKNWLMSIAGGIEFYKRYGRYYKQGIAFLRKSQWWDEGQITAYQLTKLKQLLTIAYTYVPYYREVFDSIGIDLYTIAEATSIEEILPKIPFLHKEVLRNNLIKLINRAPNLKSYAVLYTSGTTGTPIKVIYDRASYQIGHFAFLRRFYDWIGLPECFKSVRFSGRKIVEPERDSPPFWVYDIFNRRLFMSTYHMNERNLPYYIEKLNQFKPHLIDGYVSAIYILSKFILKHDVKLEFTPIGIATTAETLYEDQRATISKAFKCKVFNQYASSEGAPFITECPYGNLHINFESGIFEFLDIENRPAKPGSIAQMVVTSFRNYKVPLIRYKIGDFVELPDTSIKCECGRVMPVVKRIVGREDDILVAQDGALIGMVSYRVFKDAQHVKKSQIIQHSIKHIEVKIVKDSNYTVDDENFIRQKLLKIFGENIAITFNYVDDIPLERGGKFLSAKRLFSLKEIYS